jgi:hypothetical protein
MLPEDIEEARVAILSKLLEFRTIVKYGFLKGLKGLNGFLASNPDVKKHFSTAMALTPTVLTSHTLEPAITIELAHGKVVATSPIKTDQTGGIKGGDIVLEVVRAGDVLLAAGFTGILKNVTKIKVAVLEQGEPKRPDAVGLKTAVDATMEEAEEIDPMADPEADMYTELFDPSTDDSGPSLVEVSSRSSQSLGFQTRDSWAAFRSLMLLYVAIFVVIALAAGMAANPLLGIPFCIVFTALLLHVSGTYGKYYGGFDPTMPVHIAP